MFVSPHRVAERQWAHVAANGTALTRIVREAYVRTDLPCRSRRCRRACPPTPPDLPLLAADAPLYLVPDADTALDMADLLEQPALARARHGVVVCETVLDAAHVDEGTRMYRRLRALAADPHGGNIVFPNQKHAHTHTARAQHETRRDRNLRAVVRTAAWLAEHLDYAVPLVVLTEHAPADVPRGVTLLSPAAYVETYFSGDAALRDLVAALVAARADRLLRADAADGDGDGLPFLPHKSADTLEAGIKSGIFLHGKLRVGTGGDGQALVLGAYDGQHVVVVGAQHRNRAVHGDVVVVELLPRSQWQAAQPLAPLSGPPQVNEDALQLPAADAPEALPTGRVVGVRQRNWRPYVVTLQATSQTSGHVLAVPMDYRIPKIRIHLNDVPRFADQRLVVRVHDWPEHSMYPSGHFLRALGPVDALDTEVEAVLVENEIAVQPFSAALLASMPVNTPERPWTITAHDLAERRDLRTSHRIFSIDPKGSEDIDDALSAQLLPNGNVELGVHIADVSAFVTPGSLADIESRNRGTTVYLADRRFNMLPAVLSEDLCSLRGEQDRFAVTVLAEVHRDTAEVVATWFGRTIIRSVREMYYEQAQALLDRTDGLVLSEAQRAMLRELPADFEAKNLRNLLQLRDVCQRLRLRRLSQGALELSSSEIRFKMSAASSQEVESLVAKSELEVNRTVAEAMILANALVAERITQGYPTRSVLRRHPIPAPTNFRGLERFAATLGHTLGTQSNAALAASLEAMAAAQTSAVAGSLIRSLAVTAMTEAEYFCTGDQPVNAWYHYGLALERYTHFTSPIRRYADILVHRALLALCARPRVPPDELGTPDVAAQAELSELTAHLNRRNRASKAAQRDCTELFQALYVKHALRQRPDGVLPEDAVVFDVRDRQLLVFVPRLGLKAPVHLLDRDGRVQVAASVFGGPPGETASGCAVERVGPGRMRLAAPAMPTVEIALFDRVDVHLTLSATTAHRPAILVALVRRSARQDASASAAAPSSEARLTRTSLMGAIQRQEAARSDDGQTQDADPRWHQTPEARSMHVLLERLRDISLRGGIGQREEDESRGPGWFAQLPGRRVVGGAGRA